MDQSGMQGSSMLQGASVQPNTGPLKEMDESIVDVDKSDSSPNGDGTNLPSPYGGQNSTKTTVSSLV